MVICSINNCENSSFFQADVYKGEWKVNDKAEGCWHTKAGGVILKYFILHVKSDSQEFKLHSLNKSLFQTI